MFSKLLVPLDGSSLAEQALGPAASIARATHAAIDLVMVHQPMAFADFVDAAWQASPSSGARAYIASTAKELADGSSIAVSGTVVRGTASEMIRERAKEIGADLIVMTSQGRTGFSRTWLGSVAHEILRGSPAPILMLRPIDRKKPRRPGEKLFKKILVTLDGSALAESILEPAKELARAFDARLILLRVVEPVPMVVPDASFPTTYLLPDEAATAALVERATKELAEVAKRVVATGVARVESHVVVAERVANAILEFARGLSPSVIAMSTHGRGASRLFLGSVADKVLRATTVPLLVRRPSSVREEPALVDAEEVAEQLHEVWSV
jgi:nucleotide-binding universal stress UspA family protein